MKKEIKADYVLDDFGFVEMKYYLSLSKERKILEFVLILFLVKDNKKIEILKYDYSQKEKFHVHKNYLKVNRKEYLDFEINLQTILLIKKEIQENWGKYLKLYYQKEYIYNFVSYIFMDKLIIRHVSRSDDDIRDLFNPNIKKQSNQRILYVKDAAQLSSILSTERMSLLFDLKKIKNVSEIAKKTGRKQEAISRDATILETAGLLKKTKKGRQTFLKTKVKKIEIEL